MSDRMSAAEFQEFNAKAMEKGSNKYGAEKTTIDGITFDSKREAKRWVELKHLEAAGEIGALERQVVVGLQGLYGPILTRTGKHMRITVDFRYFDHRQQKTVYEDAKGMATRDFDVRKAVAAAQGVEIVEV